MKSTIGSRIINYSIAIVYAVVCLYPVLVMIASSFKPNLEIFKNPLSFPGSFYLDSYMKLFTKLHYLDYVKNSVFISVITVLLVVICGIMISYYIARFKFKWNGLLFFYFLIGMMLPIKLGLVPMFLLMKDLNLMNSPWSVIFVNVGAGLPMAALILTGFFRTLPKELEESAKIDGCSDTRLLLTILVPLMRPAIGTVVIINFIGVWNDFFFPMIFLQDDSKKTIPVGMMRLFSEYSTDWSVLFAGLTMSALPMIVLFLFASKQFMDGLTAGAVK